MVDSSTKPLQFLWRYLYKFRWQFIAGFFFVIMSAFFQLVIPYIIRYGIEYVEYKLADRPLTLPSWFPVLSDEISAPQVLVFFAGTIVAVAAFQGFFRYLMRMTLIGTSRKIEYQLRNDYMRHLQSLSSSFYSRNKTGDLMARATNDLDAVRATLGPGIMYMVNTLIVSIAAISLMISLSPILTFWALVPMPFVAVIVYILVRRIGKLFERIQAQFSAVTAKVQENLSGIRVLKSYVQEDHETGAFSEMNKELVDRNLALVKVRAALWTTIEFLLGASIVITVLVGGRLVIADRISIGVLVAFLAYLAMLGWPMIAFGWVLNLWQQGLASTGRVMNIMKETPEITDSERTLHGIHKINGEIEFKNLTFAYEPDGRPVLRKISLKIDPGATVAIVGGTGSGKSTLVNLIPRLYNVPEGTLRIDGQDINRIPLAVLRRSIGYVPQETFLFSETLKENISFGVPTTDVPEIEEATELSQLKSDIDQFPQRWETMIGERGLTLSGGQKQRTAISRAVIRKPAILILDDALSSVDTYTEEQILKRLRRIMKDRTTIIVSHRISTVREADFIVILEEGEIVEQGKHDDLIRIKGRYYELYQRQLLEESLELF